MRLAAWLGAALAALWPALGLAQGQAPPDIDDTLAMLREGDEVLSASRRSQPVREAPSAVTVVTADEIRAFGYRTLAEVLEHCRGFFTTHDRNYTYLGSRGFTRTGDYNSRVLVLLNGHRLNDNVYGAVLPGSEFPIDLSLVDRIEVVRGPGSALYGSNAMFAVVNVITQEAGDARGLGVLARAGSYGTGQALASYGNGVEAPVQMLLAGSALASQGQDLYFPEFDTGGPGDGVALDSDYEHAQTAFLHATGGSFKGQAVWSERTKEVPTASYGSVFNDGREETTDGRAILQGSFDRALGNGHRMEVTFAYDRTWFRGRYPYDYPPVTLNVDEEVGEWITAGALADLRGGDHTRWTLGAEYQLNYNVLQRNFDQSGGADLLHTDDPFTVGSLYVQMEQRFSSRVIGSFGGRYDARSDAADSFNPRLALVLMPRDRSTIKLLAGTAFRAPNAYELYYDIPGQIRTSRPLEPEEMVTSEILWEEALGSKVDATFSVYHHHLTNLINQIPDPSTGELVTQNTGDVLSDGIETEFRFAAAAGITGDVWLTYSRSRTDTGDSIAGSPGFISHLGLRCPLPRTGLDLAPVWRFVGSQETLAGERLGSYGVADLTISNRRPWRGWTFSASMYNLTDKHYGDVAGSEFVQESIPQDGRSFRITSRWSF